MCHQQVAQRQLAAPVVYMPTRDSLCTKSVEHVQGNSFDRTVISMKMLRHSNALADPN